MELNRQALDAGLRRQRCGRLHGLGNIKDNAQIAAGSVGDADLAHGARCRRQRQCGGSQGGRGYVDDDPVRVSECEQIESRGAGKAEIHPGTRCLLGDFNSPDLQALRGGGERGLGYKQRSQRHSSPDPRPISGHHQGA